ncbi:hypothetical protein QP027_10315 [Corynebacterium breve]|uniref:Uncharacterized protein n=1 Tax=Corynebacterium breve TaxID=3049799 RepID=A0ABY8VDR8_9CORY|nr:hypothetical protein [Corynebacterium breve]WIM67482.1 hypothetical protein QP027_10315 [Corynebacterium breve]
MTTTQDFSAWAPESDETAPGKWPGLLSKLTLALLAVGSIVGYIIWLLADSYVGEDIAVLTWVIAFAGSIALMSIRQTILAEKE